MISDKFFLQKLQRPCSAPRAYPTCPEWWVLAREDLEKKMKKSKLECLHSISATITSPASCLFVPCG